MKTKTKHRESGETITFKFGDQQTGHEDGSPDPGGNLVIGTQAGKGEACLATSAWLFTVLRQNNIPTHFLSVNQAERTMTVAKASVFSLEFVYRYYACGSFLRRYAGWVKEMQEVHHLIELTLKDDDLSDPLINDQAAVALELIDGGQLKLAKQLTLSVFLVIKDILTQYNLRLADGKLEFGLVENEIVVVDEISGDTMRVINADGKTLNQIELAQALSLI